MVKIIATLEGRMGSGKTTAAVALAYMEFLKREILRTAVDLVLLEEVGEVNYAQLRSGDGEAIFGLREKFGKDAPSILQGAFKISEKLAIYYLGEATRVVEEEGEEAYLPQLRVVCNDHLNFPYTHFDPQYLVDHMDDEELEDCVHILDEAFQIIDSRSSSKNITKLFTYYLGQTRKRGVDLYVCVHHIDEVDKRLRRKPDIRGTCRFNRGPIEDHLPVNKRRWNWVTVRFRDLRTGGGRRMKIYGPAFWPLFETKERIPMMRRQMEIDL